MSRLAGKSHASLAFTIVEILLVVALIAVLAALTVPAVSSMARARGATEAAFQVAAAAELARAEATARRTPVWLALTTISGQDTLRVAIAASRDGAANPTGANFQVIGRPVSIEGVALADPALLPIPKAAGAQFPPAGIPLTVGGVSYNGAGSAAITFFPTGEATTEPSPPASDGFTPRIGIGLAQSRGGQPFPDATSAVVVIDGSTGIPAILRP